MAERFKRDDVEGRLKGIRIKPGVTHFAQGGKVWKVTTVGADYVEAEFVSVMTPPR